MVLLLADILRGLFILELDQLRIRMLDQVKKLTSPNIFSGYTPVTNV